MRRYFHRNINCWDAATNLLLVEKRQEALREYQREKREYVKRQKSFWIEGGKQEAAKKGPRISTVESQQNETTAQQETLTRAQLKKMKVTELLFLLTDIFLSEQPTVQEILQRPNRAGKCLFCVYCCRKFSVSRLF